MTQKTPSRIQHFNEWLNSNKLIKDNLITEALKLKILIMFAMVLKSYKKYFPRRNFFSYGYICYKLLEILQEYKIMYNIDFLKSEEKLIDNDKIFIKICKKLNWLQTSRFTY